MLQGLGGVFLQALGMALVVEVFPSHERGRALGLTGGIVSVGLASGPALGGLILGTLGWSWIFWVNIPIGIMAIALLVFFVPAAPPHKKGQSFDLAGALSMTLILACYALGMTKGQDQGFGQPLIQILFAVSALGVLAFLFLEKRARQPMVDFSLFHNILFSLGIFMAFTTFILLGGTMFMLPFFLKYVQAHSTLMTGALLMVVPIAEGLISPIAGWSADRFSSLGVRLVGSATIVLGCFLTSTLEIETSIPGYILRVFPLGLGIGMFQATNNTAVMGAVPLERLGIASGLLALSRNLGVTTGLPIVGATFTFFVLSITGADSMDISQVSAQAIQFGFGRTFLLAGVFMTLPVLLGALSLWYSKKRT
jgi:EmrB/QacA subfamily drug resistance transporter